VCASVCVKLLCLVFNIAAHLGNEISIREMNLRSFTQAGARTLHPKRLERVR